MTGLTRTQIVHEKIEELQPEQFTEVADFVEFLLEKKQKRKQNKLRLSWANSLQQYRNDFTSLELQKKALEWWGD